MTTPGGREELPKETAMSYSNNHTAQLIELGGVEPLLQEQAGVRQAVVLAREDAGGKCLVAYIVVDRQNPPAVSQLRRRLPARLPDYMAPPTFVLLNELPLTPNGKVDRRALPAPDQTRPAPEDAFVAPRTPVEEGLARIWS
jgi:surfactin family lipopeptide synthetase A